MTFSLLTLPLNRVVEITDIFIIRQKVADSSFFVPLVKVGIRKKEKSAVGLKAGSVVMIPPNVKHWHGAKKDSWFSHIAIEVPDENCDNEWCEPVTEEEYNKL